MQSVLHVLLFHLRTKKSHQACLRSTHGKPSNVGVDAAARIHSSIAGRIKLRNTLPPLASNDLFAACLGQKRICEFHEPSAIGGGSESAIANNYAPTAPSKDIYRVVCFVDFSDGRPFILGSVIHLGDGESVLI